MTAYLMKGTAQGMIVVDDEGIEELSSKRPEEYLQEACIKHGSTMEGREQSFRKLTSSSQKAAVLVNERTNELWFPTVSKTNTDCQWLSYFHVVKAFPQKGNQSIVLFDNGLKAVLNCSSRTIQKQLKRCCSFLQQINENS